MVKTAKNKDFSQFLPIKAYFLQFIQFLLIYPPNEWQEKTTIQKKKCYQEFSFIYSLTDWPVYFLKSL